MRWFKHLSLAQSDEVMSELIDEFGLEGYGFWWLIIERIAQNLNDNNQDFVRISEKNWLNFTKISKKKFYCFATWLHDRKKIILKIEGKYLTIKCPRLLKYKDEWTLKRERENAKTPESAPEKLQSKSGVTPPRAEQKQKRTEENINIKLTAAQDITSEEGPNYLALLEKYFPDISLKNVRIFRMFVAWRAAKVILQDVQDMLDYVKETGKNVQNPLYFERAVIDRANERMSPHESKPRFKSREQQIAEHNEKMLNEAFNHDDE